jgi:hypothetical protein
LVEDLTGLDWRMVGLVGCCENDSAAAAAAGCCVSENLKTKTLRENMGKV